MRFLVGCILAVASTIVAAQNDIRMPTQEDIAKATEKARAALSKSGVMPGAYPMQAPSVPNALAMPKPQQPAPDISSLVEKYKALGKSMAIEQKNEADLIVMVSLAMPKDALNRIIDQAERSGATLVFRGLKGNSMKEMGEELQKLIRGRNVNIAIHPPAFQQFSVTRVPAVVLAKAQASSVMENGCAKADTYVKVSGDVSLDYALEYIERHSNGWAEDARRFRSKIVKGL